MISTPAFSFFSFLEPNSRSRFNHWAGPCPRPSAAYIEAKLGRLYLGATKFQTASVKLHLESMGDVVSSMQKQNENCGLHAQFF
jgi:hypothetical protein